MQPLEGSTRFYGALSSHNQEHRGTPSLFDKCTGSFYMHYITHGTNGFTSHANYIDACSQTLLVTRHRVVHYKQRCKSHLRQCSHQPCTKTARYSLIFANQNESALVLCAIYILHGKGPLRGALCFCLQCPLQSSSTILNCPHRSALTRGCNRCAPSLKAVDTIGNCSK